MEDIRGGRESMTDKIDTCIIYLKINTSETWHLLKQYVIFVQIDLMAASQSAVQTKCRANYTLLLFFPSQSLLILNWCDSSPTDSPSPHNYFFIVQAPFLSFLGYLDTLLSGLPREPEWYQKTSMIMSNPCLKQQNKNLICFPLPSW